MKEDWVTKEIREEREFRKLMEVAAQQLLRPRSVKVRFQETASGTESGSVSRDYSGTYVIDISPSTPVEHQYETLLHEVAHVLDTSHEILKTNYHAIPPGTRLYTVEGLKSSTRFQLEQRAKAIAAQLEDYADLHAHEHFRIEETGIHARLRALCHAKVAPRGAPDEVEQWRKAQEKLADEFRQKTKGKRNHERT